MTNYVIENEIQGYATHQFKSGFAVPLFPEQIIGLVPCQPQDFLDCRGNLIQCIEVYAKVGGNDREIDKNSFLFEFPSSAGSNNAFYLQKETAGVWADVANLTNNNYGIFYNFGELVPYLNYSGYLIDWSLVLDLQGEGKYRFVVKDLIFMNPDNDLISFPFILKEFTCERVDMTVRIESTFKGSIDNYLKEVYNSRKPKFDLVNLANGWYDSMRYAGSLGRKQFITENIVEAKLSTNEVKSLYSKKIDSYNLTLYGYVDDLLTRLNNYGFSAKDLFITDYSLQAKRHYDKKGLIFTEVSSQPNYPPNTNFAWRYGANFKKKIEQIFSKNGFID